MHHSSTQLARHLATEHHLSPLSLYLKEIVYGGTDGIITTFAVVAGFSGAQSSLSSPLPVVTVLIFGLANLFADGVSMSLGSFLSAKSEEDVYRREEEKEKKEIKNNPVIEEKETIDIFVHKGFTADQAKILASIYKTNPSYWVEFMMKEEVGLSGNDGERARTIALFTFSSFVLFGFLPLVPFLLFSNSPYVFTYSIIGTAGALFLLGILRFRVTKQSFFRSVSESLILGGIAAFGGICRGDVVSGMTFEEYQDFIKKTALYPRKGNNLAYPALGLTGEAGEVADKIKKLIRDHKGRLTEKLKHEMVKELGDVLWYLTALASELGVSLKDVAEENVKKLSDRRMRGVIQGEGDNR